MKKFKRILSIILASATVSMFFPSVLINAEESISVPGETVLYYNSFPTGTATDLGEVEHSEYYFYGRNANLKAALNERREYSHTTDASSSCMTYSAALTGLTPSEFNGNMGTRVNGTNSSLQAGPVVMFDFRYKDADKTPTQDKTLKSGIYKFSFDFVLYGDTVSTVDAFRVQANCMHGNYGNSFAWMRNNIWHNLNGREAWENRCTESNIPITDNELHRYEVIFDLDNNKVMTYMDGVRRKDTAYTGNINFLHLTMGGSVKYLDNLLLTKMDPEYVAEMNVNIKDCDENGVVLEFSDYIDDMSGLEALNFTDTFTGETVEADVIGVAESMNTLRIKPKTPLITGREYILNADIEVPGLRGGGVVLESQSISVGELKSVKTVDFNGEEKSISKEIVAEIESFKFEFKDGDAVTKLSNLTLLDEDENEVELLITPGKTSNSALATVVGALKGKTSYTLAFSAPDNDYSWDFTTGEGGFSLKPIKFFKADGVTSISLSEAAVGDKIKAKYECVNTGEEVGVLSFVLIMGLYSGEGLTYVDYEKVELEEGAKSYSTMVEFEVSHTEDLNAQGFIWKSLDTRTPLYKQVTTR